MKLENGILSCQPGYLMNEKKKEKIKKEFFIIHKSLGLNYVFNFIFIFNFMVSVALING